MTTVASTTVESSLWWDSFASLLSELEAASLSLDIQPNLVTKLKDNHAWFLDLVFLFKRPNQKSKEALCSSQVNIGSHQLTIRSQLRDATMKISSSLCLDEIQSYIILCRFLEKNNVEDDFCVQEFLHEILMQYYIDRQSLLKSARQMILIYSLYAGVDSREGDAIKEEVVKLILEGMEKNILSVLENLLLSSHPEDMDVRLFTLWSEEILIEENLLLDILFLSYYESLCTCSAVQWRKLCSLYHGIIYGSFDIGKLEVTSEAIESSYQVKVQLLLILMETLKMDNLLQMLHDDTPLRQDLFVHSVDDIVEMDVIISSFNAFEMREAGPLILTWGVFICVISSLPTSHENNLLMEIDHVGYVHQAFEAASLSYFLEILERNILSNLDGPVTLYRSVLRTFVSALISAYEIKFELGDTTLKLLLDILCLIYRGEELLCAQFWDRDSFIDRPIRCLLCKLESEFPLRIMEFIRFLAALCEGFWAAECVFNYLNESVGISSLFEIGDDSMVDNVSHIVETHVPLHVPGVEALIIPSKTRGLVLKVIKGNIALVRWEHTESGVIVLLLRIVREFHVCSRDEEILVMLDLLCRLVSFNMAVCFKLINLGKLLNDHANGQMKNNLWLDTVEIVCTLIRNLLQNSCGCTVMISMAITILAKMLRCSPSHVAAVAPKKNIFEINVKKYTNDVGYSTIPSGSWMLSEKFVKLLTLDCEKNRIWCPLVISVLEFTMQLLEIGVENDNVMSLVLFCFQYVFVNHENWKYSAKHVRWNVTLKTLELMNKCFMPNTYSGKQIEVLRECLLSDSSIHSTLCRIVCITPEALEKLYVSCLYSPMEIEGLLLTIGSAFDTIYHMIFCHKLDSSSSPSVFYHAVLSPTAKPISVITAVVSFVPYCQNLAVQTGATRLLSMLFMLAGYIQQSLSASAWFGGNDKQIKAFRYYLNDILWEHSLLDENPFISTILLLSSAARYQPAFFLSMFAPESSTNGEPSNISGLSPQEIAVSVGPPVSKKHDLLLALLQFVDKSDDLIKSNPRILLIVLDFMKALWQGAAQYKVILPFLQNSEKFWKRLSHSISITAFGEVALFKNISEMECLNLAYRYQCQSIILEIMSYEMFSKQRLQRVESVINHTAGLSKQRKGDIASIEKSESSYSVDLKGILSSWYESSVLCDLIKSFSLCEYNNEIDFRTKVGVTIIMVHVMGKLITGDKGSLSVLLIERIRLIFKELISLPSFTELVDQYSQRGYGEGEALNALILSDLFYHLEGELKGRKIASGPFKELFHFLLKTEFFLSYKQKYDGDVVGISEDVYVFSLTRLQADLCLEMWDHSGWIAYRAIVDSLLQCIQYYNSMVLISFSKHSALIALIKLLSVSHEDLSKNGTTSGAEISKKLLPSCITHVCCCFHDTIESLVPALDPSKGVLDFLGSQAELLLHLVRFTYRSLSLPICTLILNTSGAGLTILTSLLSVSQTKATSQILLTLILLSIESCCFKSNDVGNMEAESKAIEDKVELSNANLRLLIVLCKCVEVSVHSTLSLSCIDLILKQFSSPNTWFPILQKHLPLKLVILKLKDKKNTSSIPIILKFLLTLARITEGSEMLLNAGFLQSFKGLFAEIASEPFQGTLNANDFIKKPLNIWGFGLAVVTAMIHSIGDSSNFITDNVIPYFFSEKACLLSHYVMAPDEPFDNHGRKGSSPKIPLSVLKETEQTLMLICSVVKHQDSWVKSLKVLDSQLREKCIHVLAFISRGNECPTKTAPLVCPPLLSDEFDLCKKPSFVGSGHGWFGLCSVGCIWDSTPFGSGVIWNDEESEVGDMCSRTLFSDTVAIQMYRVSFILLKFFCLQAEAAVKRAEDVGFLDLAYFPELPVSEILHGLQDQAVAIVMELCDSSKNPKQMKEDVGSVCVLLLQIMEMCLYLELCLSQICGLRPSVGRAEDFTKQMKALFEATENHGAVNGAMNELGYIVVRLYPGLSESRNFLLDPPK